MSQSTKNLLKSWAGSFVAAAITALLAILITQNSIPADWHTWETIIIAGLVSVLPVIRNFLDSSYAGYGKTAPVTTPLIAPTSSTGATK
jgi:hypothetical protein